MATNNLNREVLHWNAATWAAIDTAVQGEVTMHWGLPLTGLRSPRSPMKISVSYWEKPGSARAGSRIRCSRARM